jgi:DNA-binding NarL/FixJ family response regulator
MSLRVTSISEFCERYDLTDRQRHVLLLLVRGVSPKNIADHLCVSPTTVRRHATEMYRKCGVNTQREVLAMVVRMAVAPEPEPDRATH